MKTKQDFTNGIEVDDIITSYNKGYHKVVAVHRRFVVEGDYDSKGEIGDEYNSLIEYRIVMDSKFNPKKTKRTNTCDSSYCKAIGSLDIKAEKKAKIKEVKEGYDALIQILYAAEY